MATHLHRLILCIHLIQVCGGNYTYCQEAVDTVKCVQSCPTSKVEWDRAANKMNCEEKAARQRCTNLEKFVYHCVKNGLSNGLVEVCAPLRLILGNCAEFNIAGGVLQDQESVPCIPKCASYYNSSDAYKYPDCYKLPGHTPPCPSDNAPTTNRGALIIGLTVSVVCLIILGVIMTTVFVLYTRIFNGARYPCTRQDSINTNNAGQISQVLSGIRVNISTISNREIYSPHLSNESLASSNDELYSEIYDPYLSKESLASSNDSAENRTKRLIRTSDYLKSSQTFKATTSAASTDEFFDAQS